MREMRERKVTQRHAREHRERAEREREKDRRLSTAALEKFHVIFVTNTRAKTHIWSV